MNAIDKSTIIAAVALLTLAACDACSGGKITIQSAPAVQWDGGGDKATHACAVLLSAHCPVAIGCDKDPSGCPCAVALRNDDENLGAVDLGCIIDAGADASALRTNCNVACR